ncbi:Non-reducing end beta-L-arabinofuranosidase [Poriferisphaera corsica]|uniref:Non-reducing end beta-L-arabinofuranosidase n=1 Tax=Poriferisphaera corsica TaxID=2528020 RepID=A0A517YQY3_9BACT|nr:beta-L-arabinofuranosidase domain-containing protein [Poriferisphaera corsica]QDU32639.1 Non-reducing end beta-L-arabinofuranosidase [Poriferisphaera corsica]
MYRFGLLMIGFYMSGLVAMESLRAADYPIVPIAFDEVRLTDEFWLPRLKLQAEVLLPHSMQEAQVGVAHLEAAAKFNRGEDVPGHRPHPFVDSDLYKVMEGAAYLLKLKPEKALEAEMDRIIDIIGEAQLEDGYLYPSHITGATKRHSHDGMGDRPYSFVIYSHELYNMGHMYEAAIAYYQATGKDKFLKLSEKNAEHINKVFFEGDRDYNGGKPVNQAPGHQEIELALVKLYRETGKRLYLDMAKKFLDIRGVTYKPSEAGLNHDEYAQQHLPVRDQREAVGHAVRAVYMYAGMADVSAILGDSSLQTSLQEIWGDIVNTRMHITGGLGAVYGHEGFGPQYELPNYDTYNETCAGIANVMMNYRLFLMTKEAKYLDVAEVSLFNNVLAGMNLKGDRFFYVNPLSTDGERAFNHGHKGRATWFGTACCPSNLARYIPQISGMIYAVDDDDLYLSLYASSETTVDISGVTVGVKQQTAYPFDGKICLTVNPANNGAKFSVRMRIPTWAGNKQFVPGELYHYADVMEKDIEIKINGESMDFNVQNGFAVIEREWSKGDVVALELPMDVRSNETIERVKANRGRVAFTHGPLVMCAEGLDQDFSFDVSRLYFEDMPKIKERQAQVGHLTQGVETIQAHLRGQALTADGQGMEDRKVRLIPYYAWSNRGLSSMAVWMPREKSLASLSSNPLNVDGEYKKLEASYTHATDTVYAIGDGDTPNGSHETSMRRWTSWPQKGQDQWVVLTLKEKKPIRSVGVFWFDDIKNNGGCAAPADWSVEYWANGGWKPLHTYITSGYETKLDQFNYVDAQHAFTTEKIRIQMKAQPERAMGILEAKLKYD